MNAVSEKSKGLLRIVVMLLFAAVCYHLGYNSGYMTGEWDSTRLLRSYEASIVEAERLAVERVRDASEKSERLVMASQSVN